jgi:hypothetical protein
MTLLKGLWDAPFYGLRGTCLKFSFVSLVLTVWTAATGGTWHGVVAGLVAGVVLLACGLLLQRRAERGGRAERDRVRQRQHYAELAAWPWWKWFFVTLALLALTVVRYVYR